MTERYELEKWTWTEEDFNRMAWHDVQVHALSFQPDGWEFILDLDYILKWLDPSPGENHHRFYVAPATLVFSDVVDLRIELEPFPAFELAQVVRSDPRAPDGREDRPSSVHWLWTLDFANGRAAFRSTGYTLWFRRAPVLSESPALTMGARGGLCFTRGRVGDHPS